VLPEFIFILYCVVVNIHSLYVRSKDYVELCSEFAAIYRIFSLRAQNFFPLHWRHNYHSLPLWYLLRRVKTMLLLISCTKQIFDFCLILVPKFAKIKELIEFTKRLFRSVSWQIITMLRMSLVCTIFWPLSTSAEGSQGHFMRRFLDLPLEIYLVSEECNYLTHC
jgi:hypothetical protein